jgi:hypothetical protein
MAKRNPRLYDHAHDVLNIQPVIPLPDPRSTADKWDTDMPH